MNIYNPQLAKYVNLDKLEGVDVIDITRLTVKSEPMWSESVCKQIAEERLFPIEIKDANTQREIVLIFLIFYVKGITPDTHLAKDIVLSMASMIQKDDATSSSDLIWPAKFYTTSEYKATFTINREPQERQQGAEKAKDDIRTFFERSSKLQNYESSQLKKFLYNCQQILIKSPPEEVLTRSALSLYKLLNMLALTMLRKISDPVDRMFTGFQEGNYKNNLIVLCQSEAASSYAPPCKASLERLSGFIMKNNPPVRSTIAKLVLFCAHQSRHNQNAASIIGASVLTPIAWNGMGILKMLFEVCSHFSVSWKVVMEKSLITQTINSWNTIIAFCVKHLVSGKEDRTAPWASMIDDSYSAKYRITHHHVLASLLLESMIHIQQVTEIRKFQWARSPLKLTDFCSRYSDSVSLYRPASIWLKDELAGSHTSNTQAAHKSSEAMALIIQSSMPKI